MTLGEYAEPCVVVVVVEATGALLGVTLMQPVIVPSPMRNDAIRSFFIPESTSGFLATDMG